MEKSTSKHKDYTGKFKMGNGKLAPSLFEELAELLLGLLTTVSNKPHSMIGNCVNFYIITLFFKKARRL